jgi:DNA-binding beta-propeller fold protein YncE
VNGNNNLVIADTFNNRIRQFKSHGTITTVAGNGTPGFCGDGGLATSACLNLPEAVAVDYDGNLFIADTFNNRIRKVSASGTITTVGGNGTADFCGDSGAAISGCLSFPRGVAIDGEDNLRGMDRAFELIDNLRWCWLCLPSTMSMMRIG